MKTQRGTLQKTLKLNQQADINGIQIDAFNFKKAVYSFSVYII